MVSNSRLCGSWRSDGWNPRRLTTELANVELELMDQHSWWSIATPCWPLFVLLSLLIGRHGDQNETKRANPSYGVFTITYLRSRPPSDGISSRWGTCAHAIVVCCAAGRVESWTADCRRVDSRPKQPTQHFFFLSLFFFFFFYPLSSFCFGLVAFLVSKECGNRALLLLPASNMGQASYCVCVCVGFSFLPGYI